MPRVDPVPGFDLVTRIETVTEFGSVPEFETVPEFDPVPEFETVTEFDPVPEDLTEQQAQEQDKKTDHPDRDEHGFRTRHCGPTLCGTVGVLGDRRTPDGIH
jgi:hypothetical protein